MRFITTTPVDKIAAKNIVEKIIADADRVGVTRSAIGRAAGNVSDDPGVFVRLVQNADGCSRISTILRLGNAVRVASGGRSTLIRPALERLDGDGFGIYSQPMPHSAIRETVPGDDEATNQRRMVVVMTRHHLDSIRDMFVQMTDDITVDDLVRQLWCGKSTARKLKGISSRDSWDYGVYQLIYTARILGYQFTL